MAYFWSRVREEDWCGWYSPDDPQWEWAMKNTDPTPIPAMSWFDMEGE